MTKLGFNKYCVLLVVLVWGIGLSRLLQAEKLSIIADNGNASVLAAVPGAAPEISITPADPGPTVLGGEQGKGPSTILASDITYSEGFAAELAFRIHLIKAAETSIDIVVYHTAFDPVYAYSLLSALRDAANRGVKVRYLTAWVPEVANFGATNIVLTTPQTKVPIDFLAVGGSRIIPEKNFFAYWQKFNRSPWDTFDNIHEKIMIVDGKIAITGGRGFGDSYKNWIDTAQYYRGPFVQNFQMFYEKIWISSHQKKNDSPFLFSKKGAIKRLKDKGLNLGYSYLIDPQFLLKEPSDRSEFEKLVNWYEQEPPAASDISTQAANFSIQIIHHDFFAQVLAKQGHFAETLRDLTVRRKQISDAILDTVVDRLDHARSARISILTGFLTPKLKHALLRFQNRISVGQADELIIMTNLYVPINPETDSYFAFAYGINDIRDLLKAGVHIEVLKPTPELYYNHRKIAIIDDWVLFGSHNLNFASTYNNDEIGVAVVDSAFAQMVREDLFDSCIRKNHRPLSYAEFLDHNGIFWWLTGKFMTLFMGIL